MINIHHVWEKNGRRDCERLEYFVQHLCWPGVQPEAFSEALPSCRMLKQSWSWEKRSYIFDLWHPLGKNDPWKLLTVTGDPHSNWLRSEVAWSPISIEWCGCNISVGIAMRTLSRAFFLNNAKGTAGQRSTNMCVVVKQPLLSPHWNWLLLVRGCVISNFYRMTWM